MSNGRPAVCGRPMGYVQPLRVSGATERHILAAYPSHSLDKEKERPKSLVELHFAIDKRRNDTENSVEVNPTQGPRTSFWNSFQGFVALSVLLRPKSTSDCRQGAFLLTFLPLRDAPQPPLPRPLPPRAVDTIDSPGRGSFRSS